VTLKHSGLLLIGDLQMLVTGNDIGSMSTMVVNLNDNFLFNAICPISWSPRRSEQIDYQIAVDFVNLVFCQANFVVDHRLYRTVTSGAAETGRFFCALNFVLVSDVC
jgi:hypothetical protein